MTLEHGKHLNNFVMNKKGHKDMCKNKQQTMKENDIKSIAIVAFSKKEAGNLFIRWTKAKGLYERITAIVVQRTKKTKANKHMFAIDFYEKQEAFICDLERKADA